MESGEYRLGRLRPEACGGLIIVYAVRRNPAKGRATNGIFLLCSKCLWMPSPGLKLICFTHTVTAWPSHWSSACALISACAQGNPGSSQTGEVAGIKPRPAPGAGIARQCCRLERASADRGNEPLSLRGSRPPFRCSWSLRAPLGGDHCSGPCGLRSGGFCSFCATLRAGGPFCGAPRSRVPQSLADPSSSTGLAAGSTDPPRGLFPAFTPRPADLCRTGRGQSLIKILPPRPLFIQPMC